MTLPVLTGVRPPSIRLSANGQIPADLLVNVGGTKIRWLAAEAAEQFVRLRQLVRMDVGVELGILPGGAYRTFDEQVTLFMQRYQTPTVPGRPTKTWKGKVWSLRAGMATAAVPGTSNHGLGAAVDVCELDLESGGYIGITSSSAWPWLLEHTVGCGWSWELQSEPWHLRLVSLPVPTPPLPPPMSGGRRMSHCKDALTGKFWFFGRDGTGAAFACPIDELPDDGNWATYGPIEDAVNGPLVAVPHDVLQAQYDVRGKPTSAGTADHHHFVDLTVSTGGAVP